MKKLAVITILNISRQVFVPVITLTLLAASVDPSAAQRPAVTAAPGIPVVAELDLGKNAERLVRGTPRRTGIRMAPALVHSGDYLYVASPNLRPNETAVIDVSDPGEPRMVGPFYEREDDFELIGPFAVVGNYLYLVTYRQKECSIKVVDIEKPDQPRVVATHPVEPYVKEMLATETRIYTTDGRAYVHAFDISRPDQLVLLGMAKGKKGFEPLAFAAIDAMVGAAHPSDLALVGHHLFWVSMKGTLSVFDVAGDAPRFIGKAGQNTMGGNEVAVLGDYAYMSVRVAGDGNVLVIDIHDPLKPKRVSRVRAGWITDLEVQDERVYVSTYKNALRVFDVSDPENPALIGDTGMPAAGDVEISGGYAFVTASDYRDKKDRPQKLLVYRIGDLQPSP
jgi:hypothetical protein